MTRNRANMSVLTTSIKHFTRSSSQPNKAIRRNKSHKDLKGRSKNVFIHRGHDSFGRKYKGINKYAIRTNK